MHEQRIIDAALAKAYKDSGIREPHPFVDANGKKDAGEDGKRIEASASGPAESSNSVEHWWSAKCVIRFLERDYARVSGLPSPLCYPVLVHSKYRSIPVQLEPSMTPNSSCAPS